MMGSVKSLSKHQLSALKRKRLDLKEKIPISNYKDDLVKTIKLKTVQAWMLRLSGLWQNYESRLYVKFR